MHYLSNSRTTTHMIPARAFSTQGPGRAKKYPWQTHYVTPPLSWSQIRSFPLWLTVSLFQKRLSKFVENKSTPAFYFANANTTTATDTYSKHTRVYADLKDLVSRSISITCYP